MRRSPAYGRLAIATRCGISSTLMTIRGAVHGPVRQVVKVTVDDRRDKFQEKILFGIIRLLGKK